MPSSELERSPMQLGSELYAVKLAGVYANVRRSYPAEPDAATALLSPRRGWYGIRGLRVSPSTLTSNVNRRGGCGGASPIPSDASRSSPRSVLLVEGCKEP